MILQAKSQDISHFIFEGFPGVGKRTMILALLREIFGSDEIQVTIYRGFLTAPIFA